MKTYVNLTRSQILLYYFASFIGLAPFSIKNNVLCPVGFSRKVYAVILAILSLLWKFFVFRKRRIPDSEVTFVNRFASTTVQTLFVGNWCVTLLVFVFKSIEMIDVMNQITAVKYELKNLGIEDNCRINCKNFYAKIIATTSVVLSLKIFIDFDNYDPNQESGTAFAAIFWFGDIMTTVHSHGAILIFVETMICIKEMFESLNNKLQGTVRSDCNVLSSDKKRNAPVSNASRYQRIAEQSAHRITTESETIQLSVEDIRKIGKLHRELCDLVESTMHFHTLPILFAIVRHFSNLLSNWYSMYMHVFILQDFILQSAQRLVARTTISTLELFLIAHACTSMSNVGNATKAIVHEVWNKFYPEELRDEMSKFSLQLLDKPVAASAFGFLDLGYSFLCKIFYALLAYLIIMMQFDKSQPDTRPQETREEI